MKESKVSTHNIKNGGIIELWTIEGRYYVKAAVKSVVKFSNAVSKSKAEYFVFVATCYGNLDLT